MAKPPPARDPHTILDLRHHSARNTADAHKHAPMAHPPDALAFIEEIRVAEFWRKQLGELEYSQRDPDDLFRWYQAMELRGPDEIRAYLNERMGRTTGGMVTGIVATAPHPTRDIIDIWLSTHDKARPAPYVYAFVAFLLTCLVVMPTINGCQNLQPPNPPSAWLPQSATLTTGQLNGSPQALSTLPSSPPQAPAALASPSAVTIAAQNGSTVPRSAPLGAQTGISFTVQNAASSSVSSSSLSSAASPISSAPQAQGGPATAAPNASFRSGH